jgi:hypothetical protein
MPPHYFCHTTYLARFSISQKDSPLMIRQDMPDLFDSLKKIENFFHFRRDRETKQFLEID